MSRSSEPTDSVRVSPAPEAEPRDRTDLILAMVLYGALALIFYPVSRWLVGTVVDHQQLLQGLMLLVLLATTLSFEETPPLRVVFRFTRRSLLLGVFAIALALVAAITKSPIVLFVAYVSAIGSFALYALGGRGKRLVTSLLIAFGAWLGFTFVFGHFDWPLRELAGRYSAWALEVLGQEAVLQLVPQGRELILLMTVNGRPFEVAAECNGFGLLTSGVLVALGLGIYRKLCNLDRFLYLLAAVVLALAGNVARILGIVALAPLVGEHYFVMHEIVGLIAFVVTILVIWGLIGTHRPRAGRSQAA